jgi:hypothetical protein
MRLALRAALMVILGVLLLPGLVRAQTSNGTLVGTVTDPSGAAVPNAKVKAESPQYGQPLEVTTDSAGTYRMDSVQPGTYGVTFSAAGFADVQVTDVIMRGSVTTTVDATLQVGTLSKTVIVEASAAQVIDTQAGQLGESFGKEEVENLPYTSFNPAELALTLPGVQDIPVGGSASQGFTNGFGYSVNGTRPRANNFLIDGQDDNDYSISGQAFQPSNVGAIQEFTILTNSYNAEYGRGGGSVGNYIYKSGTNGLHAQAWEIANNSFSKPTRPKTRSPMFPGRSSSRTPSASISGALRSRTSSSSSPAFSGTALGSAALDRRSNFCRQQMVFPHWSPCFRTRTSNYS